jgi:hypothetical protein
MKNTLVKLLIDAKSRAQIRKCNFSEDLRSQESLKIEQVKDRIA